MIKFNHIKSLAIIFFAITFFGIKGSKVDLVAFSFDRPMQLYAFLESLEKYASNLGEIHIIYRTSNDDFDIAYNELIFRFNSCFFHKQGPNPTKDFRPLTMKSVFDSPNEYILFAVDDIILTDFVDLSLCIKTMNNTKAYGFYLRLGKNITYCYARRQPSPIPKHLSITNDIYIYKFKDGKGDWDYPNSVDMTIYRKADIKKDLEKIPMKNPSFEGPWAGLANHNKYGLFFENSKIINIPMNLVIENGTNRNMRSYTSIELLEKFKNGLKINIDKFFKINNNTVHAEYDVEFINR